MEGFTEVQKTTSYSRGTTGYRAPELLQRSAEEKSYYSKKSDIWAIGCILYEVTFLKQLFKQDISTSGWALSGTRLELPFDELRIDHVSTIIFEDLVRDMLSLDPIHRPKITELCNKLRICGELGPVFSAPRGPRIARSTLKQEGLIVAMEFGNIAKSSTS